MSVYYLSPMIRYVPALTGLRTVAAYLVFLHHYNPAAPGTIAHRLMAQGYIGVTIFFILSGFLLYHRYADAYFSQKHWSWRTYLKNRFVRIFPLYWLVFAITIAGHMHKDQSMNWPVFMLNFSLLKGFSEAYAFSGVAQSWSLTVEACFYGLAPLLFLFLRRWGPLWLTTGFFSAALLVWATLGQWAWHGLFGRLPFVLFYTLFGRAFEFVVGMALARYWHRRQLPRYRFATFTGLVIIGTCVLWQAHVTALTHNPVAHVWSEVVVYNYLLPIGIGVWFLSLLDENSFTHRILSFPILQELGHSSYAFYLIHIGVIASGLRITGISNTGMLFVALVGLAHGLYTGVEKPLQRWLRVF